MIKAIKKTSFTLLALGALAIPGVSHAEGILGTQVWGQLSGGGASATSGLAGSVMNIYYQGKLTDNSSFLAKFQSGGGLSVYGGAYKAYFSGEYANAPFWSAGLSIYDFAGLAQATTIDVGVGYDFKVSDKIVMGIDAIYATSLDTGGSISNIGLNVGFNL